MQLRLSSLIFRVRFAALFLAPALLASATRADVVTKYAFDDNLLDTAPSGVNADTLTARIVGGAGAESYEPGIIGNAVRVDQATGTAFMLRAPSSADLNLAPNWTLEAFIKPDIQNVGEWDRLWTKWGEGSDNWHWALRSANDGLDLFVNGANRVSSLSGLPANSVPLEKWSHVALVGDSAANQTRGYINGNHVVTGTYVVPGAGAGNMNFGNFGLATTAPNAEQFTGLIDDAQIHNAAVSAGYLLGRAALIPVGVEQPPTSGLVSYWTFDGTTDDVADEYAANTGTADDNLTPRNGAANYAAGRVDQALRIGVSPGDATSLAGANTADVRLPATYTIEAWVNPSELTGPWQRLVLNWGPALADHSYHFAIRNQGGFNNAVSLFHGQAAGGEPNANGGTVIVNQWNHIAAVADGTVLRVFLNGEQVGVAAYNGTIKSQAVEGLGIADANTGIIDDFKYNGLIDDLAIWSVPLTPEQIRYQYQNGLAGNGAAVPEPSALVLASLGAAIVVARRRKKAN